jgi:hypothetical protein
MKTFIKKFVILSLSILFINATQAQDEWPKVITASDGSVVKIYEPQPESFTGNVLKFRAAISLQQQGKDEPVFGTFWSVATVETDRDNRHIDILSVKVPNLKLASDTDITRINYLKTVLESEIPRASFDLQLDQVEASLDMKTEEKKLSKGLNNNPPKIIYASRPSILVVIDGAPKLQRNNDWGVDAVVNTPFTIVKNNDGNYYLYGGKQWYTASAATGPYHFANNDVPGNLKKIEDAVNSANSTSDPGYTSESTAEQEHVVSDIIVSSVPAELIQTKGEPNLTPLQGTSLLYASNSENDLFMETNSQQYYVLLSGRWYKSSQLNGGWQYIAATSLPADFAKIPEGSPKDNVLASVAGTDAAREAVMDAQIPQTAKVDRKTATANVTYDGAPQFKDIQGTHMQYALNTPSSVIRYKGIYYCVENGVWFESDQATGPWVVAVQRPEEVDIIPPSNPEYNLKYVYIYDVDPDWAYMGYTPGYLNSFIYGPTVVYGTGYYYMPWRGMHYYPRPYTWGFSMNYNPWSGWGMGYDYSYGWFNMGFGVSLWDNWGGGWWGPSLYHPPYCWGGIRNHGYYGHNGFDNRSRVINNRNLVINNRYTSNIYNYRRDVVSNNNVRRVNNNGNPITRSRVLGDNNRVSPNNRGGINDNRGTGVNNNDRGGVNNNRGGIIDNRPGVNNNDRGNINNNRGSVNDNRAQGVNNNGGNPNSNRINSVPSNLPSRAQQRNPILSDQNGNVYQRNGTQWQQRQQGQWTPVQGSQRPEVVQNLNRQQQMMDRGQNRTQNFQAQRSAPAAPARSYSQPAPRSQPAPSNNGGSRQAPSGNNGRRGNR